MSTKFAIISSSEGILSAFYLQSVLRFYVGIGAKSSGSSCMLFSRKLLYKTTSSTASSVKE